MIRCAFLLALVIPLAAVAANYSARQTTVDSVDVVLLADAASATEVAIAPSAGNIVYEMKVKGNNILFVPDGLPARLRQRPSMTGIPFVGPWVNRLDQDAYYANGKKYILNPGLNNVGRDQNKNPMHGVLTGSSAWKVVAVTADSGSASVTSRLEFWKYPDLMAQFPFAHVIEITYRLRGGELEVETAFQNLSEEPMPLSFGYHPYFRVLDAPRDKWKLHLAAREQLVLNPQLLPTGERKPAPSPDPLPLAGISLDDAFTDLVRGADGRAEFWVEGDRQRITVIFGPKYTSAVVFSPGSRGLICIEPMVAITNALNLSQRGVYHELQSVPPGGSWRESFWVRPSGF
ncbi:MAG TPA: aldose 1-epimerase [Bryobacteraceae bacterium]|nr:aldose 1-epimerase [Bryobacteraceae bacterium]